MANQPSRAMRIIRRKMDECGMSRAELLTAMRARGHRIGYHTLSRWAQREPAVLTAFLDMVEVLREAKKQVVQPAKPNA